MMPVEMRQEELCSTFDFACDCEFCIENITPDLNKSISQKAVARAKFTRYIMKSVEEAINQVKENWKMAGDDGYKNSDSLLHIMHSHVLLQQLITLEFEPTHRYKHDG